MEFKEKLILKRRQRKDEGDVMKENRKRMKKKDNKWREYEEKKR